MSLLLRHLPPMWLRMLRRRGDGGADGADIVASAAGAGASAAAVVPQ